jgi:hypothetical protein
VARFLILGCGFAQGVYGRNPNAFTCAEAPMYVELNHLNRAIFYEAERVDLETKFGL